MARSRKTFNQYLDQATAAQVGHMDYAKSPGSALLKYLVEAKDAVSLCTRNFRVKKDGSWTRDSQDSLQHIVSAMLPAIMGHFETFQRYLFAAMYDHSIHLLNFDSDRFAEALSKAGGGSFGIDLRRLGAHRGLGVESVGLLLSDSLTGWHNPKRVNEYFDAFGFKRKFLVADAAADIEQLWQFRHAIVHTGGTLTLADAQKIPGLKHLGNQRLAFQPSFVSEVARKLHPVVEKSVTGMGTSYLARLSADVPEVSHDQIKRVFEVESSVKTWLTRTPSAEN